jgi:hypothetical protein
VSGIIEHRNTKLVAERFISNLEAKQRIFFLIKLTSSISDKTVTERGQYCKLYTCQRRSNRALLPLLEKATILFFFFLLDSATDLTFQWNFMFLYSAL